MTTHWLSVTCRTMKKQIMISKFFASKQQNSAKRNGGLVSGRTAGGSRSTKQGTEVKQEITIDSPLTKKRILNTGLEGDEVERTIATSKRFKLASDDTTPETSFSNCISKLSDKTVKKLKSFSADGDLASDNTRSNKSPGICLENMKRPSSPLISLDAKDGSESLTTQTRNVQEQRRTGLHVIRNMTHVCNSDDEPMPGTSSADCSVSEGNVPSSYSQCESFHKYTSVKRKSVEVTSSVNRKTKCKYTPLELQVVALKEKHPDAVLFVECGYKYRFFGEDAEIAAKVLKIFCHPDHNFMTASIPTHRLFVHVRRLVAAGYKVGVVKQTETAALKAAGENRAAPFSRELTALYTKSTLIGEDVDPLSEEQSTSSPNAHLTCVYEVPPPSQLCSQSKPQKIAIMSIQPSTGDVIYDCFDDGITRSELETHLLHIQPVEVLLPQTLTQPTDSLIQGLVSLSSFEDDRIRVERLEDSLFEHGRAMETVTQFYSEDEKGSELLQQVICLPRQVLSCLAALIFYLRQFNLHRVLRCLGSITQFTSKTRFMDLNGTTLRNLEIFKNLTDGGEKGTLFWVMNQTSTKFGSRLLRKWISQPLMDISELRGRQAAVEELLRSEITELSKLPGTLKRLPDLEKGLTAIYHKKCSAAEFYLVVEALTRVKQGLSQLAETVQSNVKSALLKEVLLSIPELLGDIDSHHSALNKKAAKDNDKTNLFVDESQFPAIIKRKIEIESVLSELKGHRREVRLTLRHPSLEFVTVLGTEFLVEVRNSNLKLVPSEWVKISCTKAVTRFHTPFIELKYKELCQLREKLDLDCAQAWAQFLEQFCSNYQSYRRAIHNLGLLDCLFSMVHIARQPGYCCPEMVDGVEVSITDGRHPVLDQWVGEQDQYVPNSTSLQTDGERVMIITGPNMGGKSSYIRQVALIAIMAQVGSHVPAEQARIGVFDAIYTRMGARDEIFHGRSTFMVELQEAGEIMQHSSERSLVILDELGRGTSTHDGVAIAMAALNFFITQVKCLTLFVTHYPSLAQFKNLHPEHVHNYHMSFMLQDEIDDLPAGLGKDAITFLYQLVRGSAARSYGLNVARLADVPTSVLRLAAEKSQQLEQAVSRQRSRAAEFRQVFNSQDMKELRSFVVRDDRAMLMD